MSGLRYPRSRGARLAWAGAAALVLLAATAKPAAAQAETVVPRAASLSQSASCSRGDIEITYSASGAERQITDFTAEDGRGLHHYDVEVYSADHDGLEYILSQTREPPPAGSIVAVHVTIGTSPPDAGTGEFFVAYRCDARANDEGGTNELISSCVGMFGTCPLTAADRDTPPAATQEPQSAAEESPDRGGLLSLTGANVAWLVLLGAVALTLGTVLRIAFRKRRAGDPETVGHATTGDSQGR